MVKIISSTVIGMKALVFHLSLIILLSTGCGKSDDGEKSDIISKQESASDGKIIARVDSKPIYKDDLGDRQPIDAVVDEILYQEALRQGIDKDENIIRRIDSYKRNLIVSEMFKRNMVNFAQVIENYKEDVIEQFEPEDPKEANPDLGERKTKDGARGAPEPDDFLLKQGIRLGLDKDELVQKRVNSFRRNLILFEYKNRLVPDIFKVDDITDKEIRDYYENNPGKFIKLNLEFISLRDKKLAEEIHKKAKSGEDFKKIRDEFSSTSSQAKIIHRSLYYNNQYSDMLVGKEVGSVSGILEEGDDYKIIKIKKIRKDPLSRAKPAIEYTLLLEKKDEKLREIAKSIIEKNDIKVDIYVEDQKI